MKTLITKGKTLTSGVIFTKKFNEKEIEQDEEVLILFSGEKATQKGFKAVIDLKNEEVIVKERSFGGL